MLTINIHEAKTQLSRLVDAAMQGEPFIIAKAGKPQVLVSRLEDASYANKVAEPRAKYEVGAPENPRRRIGFLDGHIHVPDDFDQMGQAEILQLFGEQP
ncbi:MAG: type II toxin-antitoxin system prevent-host-death family antitoxin [Betaproteobacteria bacterium]|nr:type II toxin-antitoxin system prevent-host-death family antitoxin [Betaproteobacteria bacterium]